MRVGWTRGLPHSPPRFNAPTAIPAPANHMTRYSPPDTARHAGRHHISTAGMAQPRIVAEANAALARTARSSAAYGIAEHRGITRPTPAYAQVHYPRKPQAASAVKWSGHAQSP
jgi:hypothetical protein